MAGTDCAACGVENGEDTIVEARLDMPGLVNADQEQGQVIHMKKGGRFQWVLNPTKKGVHDGKLWVRLGPDSGKTTGISSLGTLYGIDRVDTGMFFSWVGGERFEYENCVRI